MTEYRPIVTQVTIVPAGQTLNDERATRVDLCDEGAGAFVTVEQDNGMVRIDPEEWPALRDAIETMMARAKDAEAR